MTVLNWAEDYASSMAGFRRLMTRKRPLICPMETLIEQIEGKSKVFDIGCGTGLFLYIIWRSGKLTNGLGVDIDNNALRVGLKVLADNPENPPIRLEYSGSYADWPVDDFDAVTMIDVLHHVPPSLVAETFAAAAKRVRRGGVLIYKDMAPKPIWGALWNRLHDLIIARQWINYVPTETVLSLAESQGLTLVHRLDMRLFCYYHNLLVFKR